MPGRFSRPSAVASIYHYSYDKYLFCNVLRPVLPLPQTSHIGGVIHNCFQVTLYDYAVLCSDCKIFLLGFFSISKFHCHILYQNYLTKSTQHL